MWLWNNVHLMIFHMWSHNLYHMTLWFWNSKHVMIIEHVDFHGITTFHMWKKKNPRWFPANKNESLGCQNKKKLVFSTDIQSLIFNMPSLATWTRSLLFTTFRSSCYTPMFVSMKDFTCSPTLWTSKSNSAIINILNKNYCSSPKPFSIIYLSFLFFLFSSVRSFLNLQ